MTCAKQLSSAYLPIAAVLMSQPIYEALADQSEKLGNLGMGYTYGGHPVSAAVAVETLKIYESDDVLGHVRKVSPRFQERLLALGHLPLVGEARGVGLMGGVEIVEDKATRKQFDPALKVNQQIVARCLQHGLIVRPLPGDVIGICPPLIISETEIDQLFDRLEAALGDAAGALPKAA
jgi:4-aminobutyrate--pyruvate transaminase